LVRIRGSYFSFYSEAFRYSIQRGDTEQWLTSDGVIDGKGMFEVRKIDILKRNRNIEEKVVYLW
jgi:hypothetical protein